MYTHSVLAKLAAALHSLGQHNNEISFNQVSQLSIDFKSSASRWDAAVETLIRATDSKLSWIHGDEIQRRGSFLEEVVGGLDAIVQKIQESEDVILARLRRTRSIPSHPQDLRACLCT